jgi:hypothetical protein
VISGLKSTVAVRVKSLYVNHELNIPNVIYFTERAQMVLGGVPRARNNDDTESSIPSTRDDGINVQFSTTYGAVLILPDGGSRMDMKSYATLEAYIARNAKTWYDYINDVQEIDAPNGSLYVITGCDKCRSYELAAFHNPSYQRENLTFNFKLCETSLTGSLTHTLVSDCSVGMRHSKAQQDQPSLPIFLRGFRIAIRPDEEPPGHGTVKATSLADSSFQSIKSSLVYPKFSGGSEGPSHSLATTSGTAGGFKEDGGLTRCTNCQTTNTPSWRRDPEGKPLCESGLFGVCAGFFTECYPCSS